MKQAQPEVAWDWRETLDLLECISWGFECLGVSAVRAAHGLPAEVDLSESGSVSEIAKGLAEMNPADWHGDGSAAIYDCWPFAASCKGDKKQAATWDTWPFFALPYYRARVALVLSMTPETFGEIVPDMGRFKTLDDDWLSLFESDREDARAAGQSEAEAFETARRKALYDLAVECKKNQGLADGRKDGVLREARVRAEADASTAKARAEAEEAKADLHAARKEAAERTQETAVAQAEARKETEARERAEKWAREEADRRREAAEAKARAEERAEMLAQKVAKLEARGGSGGANGRPRRGCYEVTQGEAAGQLGVAVRTLRGWENGSPNPHGYTSEKRRTKTGFAAFVAALKRDLSTGENMMEGAGTLRLGNRRGMGIRKGPK